MSDAIHRLLTDAVAQLEDLKKRLEIIAEMLIEARNHDSGVDGWSNRQRWEDEGLG